MILSTISSAQYIFNYKLKITNYELTYGTHLRLKRITGEEGDDKAIL